MAAVTLNPKNINYLFDDRCVIYSRVATEDITAGQVLYELTTGKVGVAGANASGKKQACGIAMRDATAGEAVDVFAEGVITGFDVSGLSAGATIFLSDTLGGLDTAAGTTSVPVGKVTANSEATPIKFLMVRPFSYTNYNA